MVYLKPNLGNVGKYLVIPLLLLLMASGTAGAAETASDTTLGMNPLVFILGFFLACVVIGIVAVLSGVGGGVVYTPIMMGFTPINPFIIRGTGLVVAMAGALVAARPFLKKAVANIRLLFLGAVPYTGLAVIGALASGYVSKYMGETGEAVIKVGLGAVVIFVAMVFIFAGSRIEHPEVKHVDSVTERLRLSMTYWEESLGKNLSYKVTRAPTGLGLMCGVGFISGFFGLGAGWAIVPVFNLVMMAPLKVAATCSKVMIGMGDTAAVWTYLHMGAIISLFTIPCAIGLIVGTLIGAKIMIKVKAGFVRYIIIAVMLASGIRLLMKGIPTLLG